MKTKLTGLDRLNIPLILNKAIPEGGGLEVITIKEIIDMVGIPSEEFEEYGLKQNPQGGIMWNNEKIKLEKEFDLKKPHTEILKKAADVLDQQKKVNLQIVDTWAKIKEMR